MARLIRELHPDVAHVDPADVDNLRCAEQIQSVIRYKIDIKCEPRADAKYVATGAASIIAKMTRDQRIKELREKHGDFNSGYSSDREDSEIISTSTSRQQMSARILSAPHGALFNGI